MTQFPETPPPDWDLGNWEKSLTIHVGTVHVCRQCESIVMVTRGGVGILELHCCGKLMEQVAPSDAGPGRQD